MTKASFKQIFKTTIIKFTSSIEELQAKHPERKDLIDSMLDSLDDVSKFQSVFMEFEDEYLLECKANLRLQMVIADLKQEVLMLKQEIKDLKTEL